MERSQLHKKAKDAWEPLAMMSLTTQPTVSQETPLPEWLQPGYQPTKYPGDLVGSLQITFACDSGGITLYHHTSPAPDGAHMFMLIDDPRPETQEDTTIY
ncbi:unnamed protein product [Boreogadus saida]